MNSTSSDSLSPEHAVSANPRRSRVEARVEPMLRLTGTEQCGQVLSCLKICLLLKNMSLAAVTGLKLHDGS